MATLNDNACTTTDDNSDRQSKSKHREMMVLTEMNAILHTISKVNDVLDEIEHLTSTERDGTSATVNNVIDELRRWDTNTVDTGHPKDQVFNE